MRRLILVTATIALAALSGCALKKVEGKGTGGPAGDGSSSPAEPIRLTLACTNDAHGWVYPLRTKLQDGTMVEQGGLATFASYLSILRADNPGGVLLLDSGDLFQGTMASNLTEGAVVLDAYNHLGYGAAALGNHEFDYGPVGPVSVASQPSLDPFGALKQRLAQARFPLLAANIYDSSTGERPPWLGNDGTALIEVKGIKVGIVGLLTPSTPYVTNPVNIGTLRFGSLVPEALGAVRRLRAKGAEIVVGLAHAGGKLVVLGRIAEVSERTSKVLLVTDEFSSVAARLSSGTVEGLVQGQGTERMRMNYLHSEATVTPGDEVLTSATSATFPPGLLIGRVAKGYARDPFLTFQSAEVRPGFDPASVKEVMILK